MKIEVENDDGILQGRGIYKIQLVTCLVLVICP
jgi:hypothetical protein